MCSIKFIESVFCVFYLLLMSSVVFTQIQYYNMSDIPNYEFELFEVNGKQYYGSNKYNIFPINSLTDDLKDKYRDGTHHYAAVFTKILFAQLPEKVYVENDEFIVDKSNRLLIVSYDGKLNLWQNAPTFKSDKNYIPGTPIFDSTGKLVSIITGNKNGRYAVSCFDGYSGKFETKKLWEIVGRSCGIIYGNKCFKTREELWEYLKDRKLGNNFELQAIAVDSEIPRIILFDLLSGLEVAHSYVRGEFKAEVCDKY